MSWSRIRLGDIAIFRNGINFGKESYGKGVSFIGVSDFKNRFYPDYETLDEVKESVVGVNDYLDYGDIVFVRSNGNKELIGRCMLINTTKPKVTYSGFCIRTRIKDRTEHDSIFWTYHFKNISFRKAMAGNAIGTNIQNLSQGMLSNYEAEVPDYNTQRRIASILVTYDDLIENNQKQINLLEEAAQRLYKEWFIDLRFPGNENVEIVDGVPEGWNIRPFNEVFSYVRGKSYKSSELSESEGVLLVNLKNINAFGGYKRNAEKRYLGTYKADQGLDAGDIVMGVTDMTQERRLVGHVAIVPDLGENMTFSMDLIKLIPKSVTRGYLYSAMRFGRYSEQISPFANGVNVLHLKPEAIMNMIMVVPSKDILERYENLFESYRGKIELLEKQSNYLTEARNRLLPKLMRGEIEV